MPGGARLPSTRQLAADLAVARNTVATAYDQLQAEGYLEGREGSGTYVTRALPDDALRARPERAASPGATESERMPSRRGRVLTHTVVTVASAGSAPRAFRHGVPALDAFPRDLWARLAARRWRQQSWELFGYGDPAGYRPLREALAGYLAASRGARCDPGQVIVVAGSQQALDLAARVLLDEGDVAWIEDPGYLGARAALTAAGARVVGIPVDREGIDLGAARGSAPRPRLVYVTPSHQYPLGVTMSLARRLALIEWASRAGAWIVEDDYDSEYRYRGRPLACLQGLDSEGRAIYLGSLSKVLLPSLRLGYLVVPADLVDTFTAARAAIDRHSPSVDQAVLTDFIVEGHFARHLRRMRALYAERQAILVGGAAAKLAGKLAVLASEAGMHLVGWLADGSDDASASRRAAAAGVEAVPLSSYFLGPPGPGALMLGYTALTAAEIRQGIDRLARALANP